jgi:ADP-heptose:LPS heptosyltransferase
MALTTPTVLVLRALGIGDLLTAVPALRGLRRAFPARRIVLATPAKLAPLVPLTTSVDDILPTEGLVRLRWSGPAPVLAVNLHGAGPESIQILTAVRPARVLSHRHVSFPGLTGPLWKAGQHEIRRWCRLLGHAGISCDPADFLLTTPDTASPAPGVTVLHPGASHRSRQWPPDRYAAVARTLIAAGHRMVITGNQDEKPVAARIAAAAGLDQSQVLAGKLGLLELAALVAEAELVICGDTGIGHLATGYRTRSVRLFGPVSPKLWGPPETDSRHVVLWSGRTGDTFADQPDPGLLEIGVDDVLDAAQNADEHPAISSG